MIRIALAVTHLLALGIGLGAIHGRGRALNALAADPGALRRAFAADSWWGIAAVLWIGTGLWRVLAGTEKTPSYYATNGAGLTDATTVAASRKAAEQQG